MFDPDYEVEVKSGKGKGKIKFTKKALSIIAAGAILITSGGAVIKYVRDQEVHTGFSMGIHKDIEKPDGTIFLVCRDVALDFGNGIFEKTIYAITYDKEEALQNGWTLTKDISLAYANELEAELNYRDITQQLTCYVVDTIETDSKYPIRRYLVLPSDMQVSDVDPNASIVCWQDIKYPGLYKTDNGVIDYGQPLS